MDVLLRNCPSPNGLILNKSQDVLFVAMTRDNSVWHVPLYPDGSIQRTGRFSSYFGIGAGWNGLGSGRKCIRGAFDTWHCVRSSAEWRTVGPNCEQQRQRHHKPWGLKDKKVLYITERETGTILKIDWHCEGWLGE
jgi:gluconolactonase